MPPPIPDLASLAEQLQRVEDKLDMLLAALAEQVDEDEAQSLTLDGTYAGQERAAGTPL